MILCGKYINNANNGHILSHSLMNGISITVNDGWEKLVELQMQHPDQTYDIYIDKLEKPDLDSTSNK